MGLDNRDDDDENKEVFHEGVVQSEIKNHASTVPLVIVADALEDTEKEERCGFFCWKPEFMQRLKNMRIFLLVFVTTGLSQGTIAKE